MSSELLRSARIGFLVGSVGEIGRIVGGLLLNSKLVPAFEVLTWVMLVLGFGTYAAITGDRK